MFYFTCKTISPCYIHCDTAFKHYIVYWSMIDVITQGQKYVAVAKKAISSLKQL